MTNIPTNNNNRSYDPNSIDQSNTSNNIFKLLLSPSLKKKPTKVTRFLDASASLLFFIRRNREMKLVQNIKLQTHLHRIGAINSSKYLL